jgi:ATP adenylyltransferase
LKKLIKDKTDFRSHEKELREPTCPFCQAAGSDRVIERNDYAFTILDKYPVTKSHTLIVPFRHFSDFFNIAKVECDALFDLIRITKKKLQSYDGKISGFNIGVNAGEIAGQTIPHCHIHLIPRRQGDIDNPKGGVRGVIPEKRIY